MRWKRLGWREKTGVGSCEVFVVVRGGLEGVEKSMEIIVVQGKVEGNES